MTTEAACMDVLNGLVTAALSPVPCIKGYPALERPDLTVPSAAIWWIQSPPSEVARISANNERSNIAFGLAVFAKNEPALLGYVAAVRAMLQSNHHAAVGGVQMRLQAETLERLASDQAIVTDATRYALQATIIMQQE